MIQHPTIEEIYQKLTDEVIGNFPNYSTKSGNLRSELPEGIRYCCVNLPMDYLLGIENEEDFINECYFKILNRPVEDEGRDHFLEELTNKKINRADVISELMTSEEFLINNIRINLT